ncbi:MAG TPA: hypothetical protein IAB39_09050 [Candidatus Onthovicinus excrementipullorum]|nr:hypothetical protein [Candidatus Onthovicinus excrementipullorum]
MVPEINYNITLEIDVSDAPHTEPEWADLGVFTKNVAQALNEVLYQATYYSDGGWGSTEVTGGQYTVTLTGDRKNGDPACDYIFDKERQFAFGDARKTKMRIRRGNEAIVWDVTLANITDAMGDANQPNAATVTIHGNGKPTFETISA